MKNNDLKQLILDNPDCEILVMASVESIDETFDYYVFEDKYLSCDILELTRYKDKWLAKCELKDEIIYDLEEDDLYENLTDDEFYKLVETIMKECVFKKYIVIFASYYNEVK